MPGCLAFRASRSDECLMLEWLQTNETLAWWMAGASLVILFGALLLAPWVAMRIPRDYFARPKQRARSRLRRERPALWVLLLVVKNAVGGLLVLAGIAMLVLPGQGLLTILIGIAVMSFPGKYCLERWIISRGPTLRLINALRRRYGRPPLVLTDETDAGGTA